MTRQLDDKYVGWFVGYYDDFIGSYCMIDDKNGLNDLTVDHKLTHHGNTLNGEAPLNPLFRFSVIERQDAIGSTISQAYDSSSRMQGIPEYTGAIHNAGIHEYITNDPIRLSFGANWEGAATYRAPQSFTHQNRAKTGITNAGVTTDGVMWVANPRRTSSKYWFIHDHDGSHGRADLKDYTATSGSLKHPQALTHVGVTPNKIQRNAYMTGVFQWQAMRKEHANSTDRFAFGLPITAKSGQPFLVLDTVWKGTPTDGLVLLGEPVLMQYEGTLNALGDKDVFHMRVARQAFMGGDAGGLTYSAYEPTLKLQIGFDEATAVFDVDGVEDSGGTPTTPCITINTSWNALKSDAFHYAPDSQVNTNWVHSPGALGNTMEDIWVDIDVEFDFTNQSAQLYIDGVASGDPIGMGTHPDSGRDWKPSDLYGWCMRGVGVDFLPGQVSSDVYSWNQIIMIDRVMFGKNITNHIGRSATAGGETIATTHTSDAPMLQRLQTNMTSNGSLTGSLSLIDDNDNLNIYPLISGGSKAEYMFMLFRNGDYRPIITSTINSVRIKQGLKQNTKEIEIALGDVFSLTNTSLPVWELGSNTYGANDDIAVGRRGASETLADSLYFGAVRLKICDDKIGYVYNSTSALSYKEMIEQRTKLYSAHPIQIYNNEDTLAPNFVEREWNYKTARCVFTHKESSGSLSTTKCNVALPAHGLSASATIDLIGDETGTGKTISSVTTDNIVLTHSPNTEKAQSSNAGRIVIGGSNFTAFKLDAGTYSAVENDIIGKYVGFLTSKTSARTANIDNEVYKILGKRQTPSGDIYISTDMPWSYVSADANKIGDVALTDAPFKLFWNDVSVNGTGVNDGAPFTTVKNRVNHAVWMRDITSSLWFKKQFGKIAETPKYTGTITAGITTASTQITTNIGHSSAIETVLDAGGVGEMILPNGKIDSFCFSGATNSGGNIRLDGVKFLSNAHSSGAVINIRDISNDFKHVWVLWADMRNNGYASADGNTRKNEFGLIYPTPDNYSVTLQYTDQEDIDGNPINFVDLNIGEDCDIWECDAENEPYSTNSWSSLGSDSNSLTHLRNWEDKAGAFLLFDFSKFFNLNTEANGGKCNQESGGRYTLGDLVIETEGHPALIDDYWQEAPATPANSASPIVYNKNWYRLFSSGSNLAANTGTNNVAIGDTDIKLENTSEFPNEGIGMIELIRTSSGSNNKEVNLLFFSFKGNNTSTNTLSGVDIVDLDESVFTEEEIISYLFNQLQANALSGSTFSGSPQVIRYNDEINSITDGYDTIVAYSGLSAPLALRFMMNLNGFIVSRNSGTFYAHEVMRALGVLAGADIPLSQFTLPFRMDINNMPITRRMTTTQKAVNASVKKYDLSSGSVFDWDDYGGAFDARDKTFYSIVSELASQTRIGENSQTTIFTYTTGRDGKTDLRPAYSSGYVFTRNNLRVSNMTGSPMAVVTNVRVYYNGGNSFIDYPSASLGSETRWKIIDMPNVKSGKEATNIAQQAYEKAKESPLLIEAEMVAQNGEDDKMLWDARYGYILDPALRTINSVLIRTSDMTWTSWFNGAHYTGMQNGLDGNLVWDGSTGFKYNTNITGHPNGGGVSGHLPTGDIDPEKAYTWIGTKSVSDAVQVVHIPKGMPTTSNTHGEQLRVVIMLADSYASSTDIDDVEFIIGLVDPNTSFTLSGGYLSITDNYGSQSSLKFKHSGFHEIEIPSTYWTTSNGATGNERIILSLNAEYLRALLRHRCGVPTGSFYYANAHDVAGFNTTNGGSEVDQYSIFPLGMRIMNEIPTGQNAPIYHAPRLSVVEDLNFYPSTVVTYTDASLGLSSATQFSVKSVNWTANVRDHDKVKLILEKDESKAIGTLASYILPEVAKGRTPSSRPDVERNKPYRPLPPPESDGSTVGGGTQTYPARPPGGLRTVGGAGVSAGTATISGQLLTGNITGVNNTTPDLLNRIKGKMDLHNQFGNRDGDFSILGQKNSGATPQMVKGLEGAGVVWESTKGAVFSSEGAVLPGITTGDDALVGATHQHRLTVTVPTDVIGKKVVLAGRVSCGSQDSEGAVLSVKLECIETGASVTKSIGLLSNENETQTFATCDLDGADVVGNTIRATIRRQVNTGSDNAKYSAVVMHEMDIRFTRAAISGRSDTYKFLGLKSGGTRNL